MLLGAAWHRPWFYVSAEVQGPQGRPCVLGGNSHQPRDRIATSMNTNIFKKQVLKAIQPPKSVFPSVFLCYPFKWSSVFG